MALGPSLCDRQSRYGSTRFREAPRLHQLLFAHQREIMHFQIQKPAVCQRQLLEEARIKSSLRLLHTTAHNRSVPRLLLRPPLVRPCSARSAPSVGPVRIHVGGQLDQVIWN
jgi:hypothetical protein